MPNRLEAPCGGILLNPDQFDVNEKTCVISIKSSGDYPPGEGPANDAEVQNRVQVILEG